jgi:hypothetical protein
MELEAIFGARGALQATIGLTAAYLLAVALWSYNPDFGVERVLINEGLFAVPVMVACGLSLWLDSAGARRILLGFTIFYAVFSWTIFYAAFTREHDAQWQLALLQVPLGGFAALVIAGVIAVLFGRARRR